MKIAFLSLYSGIYKRGGETFVNEVALRLADGHEVFVFQAGLSSKEEKFKTVKIDVPLDLSKQEGTGRRRNLFFFDYYGITTLKFIIKALTIIWREGFDVIVPTDGGWETVICRILTWLQGGKLVVSGQSGPGHDDRWNLFSRPNIFIALTSASKKWAQKAGFGVKIEMIPNGVDTKKFNPRNTAQKVNLKKPIVLCVSALAESKRVELAIKAVAKLKQVSFLVMGEGDMKGELGVLGRRLLGDRFLITSANHEEMPGYYATADLFTMVSVPWESFGIVYAEAMASGLAVVATDTEARREIIGEAGLFVDPEKTDEYAEALGKALKTDWGDKPRKQAEKFSWDKIAEEYEKVMASMVK